MLRPDPGVRPPRGATSASPSDMPRRAPKRRGSSWLAAGARVTAPSRVSNLLLMWISELLGVGFEILPGVYLKNCFRGPDNSLKGATFSCTRISRQLRASCLSIWAHPCAQTSEAQASGTQRQRHLGHKHIHHPDSRDTGHLPSGIRHSRDTGII